MQVRLPGAHPGPVAPDRVDLAVVRAVPERLGERPRRKGVRRIPAVDEGDRRHAPRVTQVRVEQGQLPDGEHPLVHDRAGGQRREVDGYTVHRALVFGAAAQRMHGAVEVDPGIVTRRVGDRGGHEQLGDVGSGPFRRVTEVRAVRIDGDVAPAEDVESLRRGERLDDAPGRVAPGRVAGKEAQPGGVVPRGGKIEGDGLAVQFPRHRDRDSGAVAGVRFAAARRAVGQGAQRRERIRDDAVGSAPVHIHDPGDAAGVHFACGIVEPARGGESVVRWVTAEVWMVVLHRPPAGGVAAPGCAVGRVSLRRSHRPA